MAVESADDRAIFLAVDDFGVAATIGGSTVNGIFDNEYIEVETGAGVGVSLQQPRFTCRSADVLAVVEGTSATISGVSYTVRIVQPDGTGMTELILEVV